IVAVTEALDRLASHDVSGPLSPRCNPAEDHDILRTAWSTGLDRSQYPPELRPYGSKVLNNACKPHKHIKQFPQATLLRQSVYERTAARWSELGFDGAPPKLTAFHDK